jgi:hypothetical protein
VAFDADHASVEQPFRAARDHAPEVLPLVQDLADPSPSTGWHSEERRSLISRGPADLGLALALVHHLSIGNQIPLDGIARFFAGVCRRLIIESVPKEDAQVQRMLALREHSFDQYTQAAFERAFAEHFAVHHSRPIDGTLRRLYLMERVS